MRLRNATKRAGERFMQAIDRRKAAFSALHEHRYDKGPQLLAALEGLLADYGEHEHAPWIDKAREAVREAKEVKM